MMRVLTAALLCGVLHCRHLPTTPQYSWSHLASELQWVSLSERTQPAGVDQPTVVLFAATWSFQSLIDLESIRRVVESGVPRPRVVVVMLDAEGDAVVRPFLAQFPVGVPVAIASARLRNGESELGAIRAIPLHMHFDRNGELIAVRLGPMTVEAMIGSWAPLMR